MKLLLFASSFLWKDSWSHWHAVCIFIEPGFLTSVAFVWLFPPFWIIWTSLDSLVNLMSAVLVRWTLSVWKVGWAMPAEAIDMQEASVLSPTECPSRPNCVWPPTLFPRCWFVTSFCLACVPVAIVLTIDLPKYFWGARAQAWVPGLDQYSVHESSSMPFLSHFISIEPGVCLLICKQNIDRHLCGRSAWWGTQQ